MNTNIVLLRFCNVRIYKCVLKDLLLSDKALMTAVHSHYNLCSKCQRGFVATEMVLFIGR